MGSISNSLNSLNTPVTGTGSSSNSNSNSSSNSSSNPTGIFTGTSAYSQDFQNVINRAVAIASMPITLLANQQTTLTSQSNELTTLDTLFGKLQTAVQGIGTAMSGSSFQAEYSSPDVVTATLGNGATEGVYSINVTNPGAYAMSLSAQAWPTTATQTKPGYQLVIGSSTYTVTASDNSIANVVSAINAQYGSLVNATAVNVGSAASPSYRISLQSTTLGPMNLDLQSMPASNPAGLQQQGPFAVSQSTATWDSDAAIDPTQYTLVANGNTYSFSAASNSAQDVAAAINSQLGSQANVLASVVDLGSTGSPDQRIVLRSLTAGTQPLDITNATENSGVSLQTAQTAASSRTAATWNSTADPSGNPSVYHMVIGSSTYSFIPSDNSAATVAAAINSRFGSQVKATVVNLAASGTPDYRIELTDLTGTNPKLDLQNIAAVSYQAQKATGVLASYEMDGSGVTVTSATRNVTVAPGVTLTLQGTGSTDITVTRSTSVLNTALSSFVDAYNAIVDELAKQQGQGGGPLQGQAIVNELRQTLSGICTYSDGSQIGNLTALGLTLDQSNNGHLDYNALTLMGADLGNSAGVTAFLGSASGGGFLQSVTTALKNLEDPTAGLLKSAESGMQTQITNIASQIATKTAQVDQLQTNLTNQMAASDAMIASMEQQYTQLSAMFQAQQTANLQYANGA